MEKYEHPTQRNRTGRPIRRRQTLLGSLQLPLGTATSPTARRRSSKFSIVFASRQIRSPRRSNCIDVTRSIAPRRRRSPQR